MRFHSTQRPRRGTAGAAAFGIALALGIGAAPAAAQLGSWTPTEAPALNDGDQIEFAASSGVTGRLLNGEHVRVGPYTARLNSDPTKPTFSIYCVDFEHSVSTGETWTTNVSDVTAGGLGDTRLGLSGDPDALIKYEKAVWLAQHFGVNQTASNWMSIQDAIWAVLTPGSSWTYIHGDWIQTHGLRSEDGLDFATTTTVHHYVDWWGHRHTYTTTDYTATYGWLAQVNDAFASGTPTGFNTDGWMVLTDVRAADTYHGKQKGVQEFLAYRSPSTTTPEPVSMALLGTGLAGLAAARRKRRSPDRA